MAKPNQSPNQSSAGDGTDYEMPKEFQPIETGFPPYWVAEEGSKFMGIVLGKDESDDEFIRYVVQATKPVKAYRGAKRGESVTVPPGGTFTLSVYATLNLDNLIGEEIFVKTKGKVKAETPAGFVWQFEVGGGPEVAKKLLTTKAAGQLPAASSAS